MIPLRPPSSDDYQPTLADTPFDRLGGRAGVEALVELFYDDMSEHEPALAAVHRLDDEGRVDRVTRERFGLFLVGWLGGPPDYTERYGHPRLRMRHARVPMSAALRDAWLRSMGRVLDARGVQGGVRDFLDERFRQVATFLAGP